MQIIQNTINVDNIHTNTYKKRWKYVNIYNNKITNDKLFEYKFVYNTLFKLYKQKKNAQTKQKYTVILLLI